MFRVQRLARHLFLYSGFYQPLCIVSQQSWFWFFFTNFPLPPCRFTPPPHCSEPQQSGSGRGHLLGSSRGPLCSEGPNTEKGWYGWFAFLIGWVNIFIVQMGILLGDELELRRQLEQMDWMEGFLRMQQRALSPVDFLNSWNRHTQMRGEVHAFNHFRAQVEVQPDLKVR